MSLRSIAVFAVLGIAIVTLFPAVCGPFTATHGPASALRAIAYSAFLLVIFSSLAAVRSGRLESYVRQTTPFELTEFYAAGPILELRC